MGKDTNRKMDSRLELMGLLVLLTAASSIAQSSNDFTEAMVRQNKTKGADEPQLETMLRYMSLN